MFCINCFHKDTRVTNSRPSKKEPRIWRRRNCPQCGVTFTTQEFVAIEDYLIIDTERFSVPRLAFSLADVLSEQQDAADAAYWLARTVGEQLLALRQATIKKSELVKLTFEVIMRFDPDAGLRYGFKYQLISSTAKPRRGRPRLRR